MFFSQLFDFLAKVSVAGASGRLGADFLHRISGGTLDGAKEVTFGQCVDGGCGAAFTQSLKGAKAGEVAADAMDVGQTQSEPESDGQEDEWEYDYYAVVPEGGGAGGDGRMGAVEMDTAGGSGANADWVRKYPQLTLWGAA